MPFPIILSGVLIPAGTRLALVKQLFTQHAPVTADTISNETCLAPIRAAGHKCVSVKFETVKEKLAAFQATSALRRRQIYLHDDIPDAPQATSPCGLLRLGDVIIQVDLAPPPGRCGLESPSIPLIQPSWLPAASSLLFLL